VVRTIEIGEARPGLHFLSTEWASGELLEKYAKRNAPLPPAEVANIVSQIAEAVHAAHVAGIIHRDLKPEERLTRAGFFVGTLTYVAPEALSGQLVTPAADQYSLATIAYYLLSGALPYAARSQREM